jgi:alpha-galactosidase
MQIQIGLWGLVLNLQPGQSLPLPRVLIAGYDGDLEAGGNALRRHIRRHVMPKLGGEEVLPPTSFNHWFAFSNKFTAESMKPAVDASAAAGLEYFCVDGGWFRGDFRPGIGNWEEGDPAKFPDGIAPFADYVRAKGMKYGTWFEPEWANTESDLYLQHPEWFWETPTLAQVAEPHLYVQNPAFALMNFGLAEVRQWWLDRLVRAYEEWGVRWIRWDYNQMPRPNWEHNVPTGELGWRQIQHVLGFYKVLDDVMAACPELFIEQCASGGHRIELGTIRRGHSFWMNDHTTQTDIVRAMQHGLNAVMPGNYANTNLCQFRHNYTDYDFLSHGAGGFGYSGKIWEAPRADFERYVNSVTRFKGYRHLLLGDYSRPTGQPSRADDYAKVVFSDGQDRVAMEFNHEGFGSARIQ